MNTARHRGSCLCGAVHYRVDGDFERVTHCHCSMCRKTHGAAFATYATVAERQLRIDSRADDGRADTSCNAGTLRWYRSSASVERGFCSGCGASLFWRDAVHEPGRVAFSLGTLDTPLAPGEQRHIHVDAKADWYRIEDHWPQSP